MTNEKGSGQPTPEPKGQPSRPSPVPPSAPLKGALTDNGERKSNETEKEAMNLRESSESPRSG